MKPLNRGHLRVLKNLSVIKRCPLLGGSLTKIVTFGTKHFVRYSRHVRYLGCPLLGGFTVNVFAENGHSITVLEKVAKEYMNNITSVKEKVNIETIKNSNIVKLPWVPKLGSKLRKELNLILFRDVI